MNPTPLSVPASRHIRKLELTAAPSRVWDALTLPEQLGTWAFGVESLEAREGGAVTLSGEHLPLPIPTTGVVSQCIAQEKLELRWQQGSSQHVWSWQLEAMGEGSRVTFEHSVQRAEGNENSDALGGHPWVIPAWQAIVVCQLRDLVEGRAGDPLRADFTRNGEALVWLGTLVTLPASKVYALLTDAAQIALWWGRTVQVGIHEGGRFDWRIPGVESATLLSFKKPRVLVSRLHAPEMARDTRLTWSLMPTQGRTAIELVQEGFGEGDSSQTFRLIWTAALLLLKAYAETGWQLEGGVGG